MKNLKKMVTLGAAMLMLVAALLTFGPMSAWAAESSFKFSNAFVGIQARLLALVFNTSTGHSHDGVNSRSVTITTAPSAQTIAATNTVAADACGTVKRITSAGAVATDTTNTFTAPAAANANCCMDVVNVGGFAITLDNNALFNSSWAADVVLGSSDTVRACSTGASGMWYQIGATGNN